MEFFSIYHDELYITLYIVIYIIWLVVSMIKLIQYMNLSKHNVDFKKYQYYREVPDSYGPQTLAYLLKERKFSRHHFDASILELVRRGVLKAVKDDVTYKLTDGDISGNKYMDPSEKFLKTWLLNELGDGHSFKISDLSLFAYEHNNDFNKMFSEWEKIVKKESNCLGFFGHVEKGKYLAFFMVGIVFVLFLGGGLSFLIGDYLEIITYGMLFLFVFAMFVFSYLALKIVRTKRGYEEYAKVMGLKRFLKDFSDFKCRKVEDVKLWEQYMVWATAFGITGNVFKKLDNIEGMEILDTISYLAKKIL